MIGILSLYLADPAVTPADEFDRPAFVETIPAGENPSFWSPWIARKRIFRGGGGARVSVGTVSGSPPPAAPTTGCTFSSTGPLFPCTF